MVTSPVKWRLADGVRRPRPSVLVGGSPWRALRLTEQASEQLDGLLNGEDHPRLARLLLDRGVVVADGPPATRVSDVTVVIPTISDGRELRQLIDAIPGECWVIVVNDGEYVLSTMDDRTSIVSTLTPFSGPAVARNVGLALVTTPFVAFVDDDVRIDSDWLVRVRGQFINLDINVVAGRIRSQPGKGVAGFLEERACALDMGKHSGPIGVGRDVSYVPSAAFMARAAALRHGFDPELVVGEDVDLIWRLEGLALYDADIVAHHAPRSSMREVLRRRFEYGTSAATLDERHPGQLRHLVLSDWTALPWIGMLAFGLKGAAAGLAVSVVQGPRSLPNFPTEVAVETMLRGQFHAAKATSRAALRPYWPVTLAASLVSKRFRRRVLPALLAGYLLDGGNPATVLDDVAYGAGVWAGCVRERNIRPLLPRFHFTQRSAK